MNIMEQMAQFNLVNFKIICKGGIFYVYMIKWT